MQRTVATERQILAAVEALARRSSIPAKRWPGRLEGLERPGLYAWFVDRSGADDLSAGYGLRVTTRLAYVGEAGVDTDADLRERVGCHLGACMVRRSTLRRTLTCGLLQQHGWTVVDHRKLAPGCETQLTDWMAAHLRIAVHPFDDRIVLEDLETRVIERLAPQLNLPRAKLNDTALQTRIRELRKQHDLQ
jgi:hypothetical protein